MGVFRDGVIGDGVIGDGVIRVIGAIRGGVIRYRSWVDVGWVDQDCGYTMLGKGAGRGG